MLPTDPFAIKALPKMHPRRLLWTLYGRACDRVGRLSRQPIGGLLNLSGLAHYYADRGVAQEETKLTTNKTRLLLDAVAATAHATEPIVEIGSYRGATTEQLAAHTERLVYAVDPYIGYGGWEEDAQRLAQRCLARPNIVPVREASGKAVGQFADGQRLSLIIVDAVNDYVNAWFNVLAWAPMVSDGALVALNSVDDSPGPNLACRRLLRRCGWLKVWGYCPDLIVFQKIGAAMPSTKR